jgi:hypothetical protein
MNWVAKRSGVAIALLLVACASPETKPKPADQTRSQGQATIPARSCLAKTGQDRAMCVTLLGALRTMWQGKKICSPVPPEDLADTYAVMDWVRAHPEVNDEELGDVAERVLTKLHPC